MFYFYQGQYTEVTAFDKLPSHLADRLHKTWTTEPVVDNRPPTNNYVSNDVDDLIRHSKNLERADRQAIVSLTDGQRFNP